MKQQMKCWKVICNATRTSMINSSPACLHYPKGTTVRPKLAGSRLMVFKKFSDAKRFFDKYNFHDLVSGDTLLIVPCIAYRVTRAKWVSEYSYSFVDFWIDYNNRTIWRGSCPKPAPQGTYFAKSVKCLE